MFRVTTTRDDPLETILKLEGRLLADWVGELQEACRRARAESCHLALDLSGLLFVDAHGTRALRELLRQGSSIAASSPFVDELLKEG